MFGSDWRLERLLVFVSTPSNHRISKCDCEIEHPDDIFIFLMELMTLCATIGL